MTIPPKNGKLLYHLTSIENLESIFKYGLLCRNSVKTFYDIADKEIIEHREKYGLNEYVPFHFLAPSPLHGIVQKKNKAKKFCYITVHRDIAIKNKFKILKQHPLTLDDCTPLDYQEGIAEIDWETMAKRDYTDHNCKEICLAECLAKESVTYNDFFSIIVKSREDKREVERLIAKIIGTNNSFFINVQNYIFVK